MNPIEWNNLSKEEKEALIDTCKEDPVVFIETVCGVELLEYQKVIVRETFKRLRKSDKSEVRSICLYDLGNWLLTFEKDFITCGEALSSEEAQNLLLKYDVDAYEKIFGELEEV